MLPIHKRLAKSGKVIWQAKWPSVVVAQTILCRSIFQVFFVKNKVEMFIKRDKSINDSVLSLNMVVYVAE